MDLLIAVGLIVFAAYWAGWRVGRTDRLAPPPWPEAEDCEPLSPLERRILPYVRLNDLPDLPRRELPRD